MLACERRCFANAAAAAEAFSPLPAPARKGELAALGFAESGTLLDCMDDDMAVEKGTGEGDRDTAAI